MKFVNITDSDIEKYVLELIYKIKKELKGSIKQPISEIVETKIKQQIKDIKNQQRIINIKNVIINNLEEYRSWIGNIFDYMCYIQPLSAVIEEYYKEAKFCEYKNKAVNSITTIVRK